MSDLLADLLYAGMGMSSPTEWIRSTDHSPTSDDKNPLLVEFQKAFPALVNTFNVIGMSEATFVKGNLIIPSEKYRNISISEHKMNKEVLFVDINYPEGSSNTFHIDDNKSIEEQIFDLFELIVHTITDKAEKKERWVEAFQIIYKVSKCGHELSIEGNKIFLDESWLISPTSVRGNRIAIDDELMSFSVKHDHYLDSVKCLSEFLDMVKTWDREFDCDYNLEFDEESTHNEDNNMEEDDETFPGEKSWKTS